MGINTAACWMLIVVSTVSVTGKPVSTMQRTQKRQSDQRVAELETLLALQKYGAHHHFLRAQSMDGGGGSFSPAYGIIDFNKIGRKKKASPPLRMPPPPPSSPEVQNWMLSPSRPGSQQEQAALSLSSSSFDSNNLKNNPSSEIRRMSVASFRGRTNHNHWIRDNGGGDQSNLLHDYNRSPVSSQETSSSSSSSSSDDNADEDNDEMNTITLDNNLGN